MFAIPHSAASIDSDKSGAGARRQHADGRQAGSWFEVLESLRRASPPQGDRPQGPHSDLGICSTIRAAIAAAEADPTWSESGVTAHLQSALDIATQGDCPGAKAAALGLTDFVSIAQRNAPSDGSHPAAGGTAPLRTGAGPHLASSDDLPWAQQEQQQQQEGSMHKSRSWDACSLATEALHTRGGSGAGAPGSPLGAATGSPRGDAGGGGLPHSDSGIEDAAAHAVAEVDASSGGERHHRGLKDMLRGGVDMLRGGAGLFSGHRDDGGARGRNRSFQKSLSEEDARPSKRQRAGSPPLPPRSLSDPGHPMRRTSSAALMTGPDDAGGLQGGGAAAAVAGTAAADEGFPGHNSVEDVHPAGKLLRQAKNALDSGAESTSYWAGKVKHRLGTSTVELFFLSALLPAAVIEHMPPSLFVTDLVQRNSLAIGSEHTVIRCRLDFLTNRQLRKLRTLAELRLAAVSSLQHCAITLVPYLDAQRGLRIIGFVKVDKS